MRADPELTTRYLRDLVRIDTSNPPGNESEAAGYVSDVLQAEGIEAEVLESAPGRGSLVARIRARETGTVGVDGGLLLLSHLDVVPAAAQQWSHPPFAAELHDGCVWGRGAMDCKVLTATHMAILVGLQREGVPLCRDLVMAATADEEAGGGLGLGWLVSSHPELVSCAFVINEGGGFGLEIAGRRFYLLDCGEKGVCWLRLTARGEGGHGSMPHRDQAVVGLADTVSRLARANLPQHRTGVVQRTVHTLARALGFPAGVLLPLVLAPGLERPLLRLMERKGEIANVLRATLHNTVAPTVLAAGSATNIIPREAVVELDGRLIPGQTPADLIREVQPHLASGVATEVLKSSSPWASDPSGPLYEAIETATLAHDPGSALLPFLMPGGSDARYLAERGAVVFGFYPMKQESGMNLRELIHSPDERVSLSNIEFGTRVLDDIVRRFCLRDR